MSLTTEIFIQKAKSIHGDKYDYSKVEYINCRTPVCIICKDHGEFMQVPYYHLNGNGCPKCFNEQKRGKARQLTTEEFVRRAQEIHGGKYDYSKVKYVNSHMKVCIICPEHGEFLVAPYKHLNGHGCRICGIKNRAEKRKLTLDEFVKRAKAIHGDKYDYSKVEYINSQTKVCIICPEHGEFWQTPNSHLDGSGCHECNEWEMEYLVKTELEKNNIRFEREKNFDWLVYKKNLRIDFYLPDYNIGIECQGEQHYLPIEYWGGDEVFKKIVIRDSCKKQLCEKNGVKLLFFTVCDCHNEEKCFTNTIDLIKYIKDTKNG